MDMLNVIAPIARIGFRTLGGDFPPCPSLLQPLITVQEPGENILAAIKLTGSCSLKGSLYGSSQLPCFPLSHSWSFANENNVQCIYSCLEEEFTDACIHKVYACKKKAIQSMLSAKMFVNCSEPDGGVPLPQSNLLFRVSGRDVWRARAGCSVRAIPEASQAWYEWIDKVRHNKIVLQKITVLIIILWWKF